MVKFNPIFLASVDHMLCFFRSPKQLVMQQSIPWAFAPVCNGNVILALLLVS